MSSMFKKKGGPAFKPKIPSARPRPTGRPAAAAQRPTQPQPTPDALPDAPPDASSSLESAETRTVLEKGDNSDRPSAEDTQSLDDSTRRRTRKEQTTSAPSEPADEPSIGTAEAVQEPASREAAKDTSSAKKTAAPAPKATEREPSRRTRTQARELEETRPSDAAASEDVPAPPAEQDADSSARETPAAGSETTAPRRRTTRRAAEEEKKKRDLEGDEPSATKAAKRQRQTQTPQSGEEGSRPATRRRRARTAEGDEPRASRRRSLTPEDAEEQVVDLQKLKMSDLTKDLHIGKKFSRHDELRERERQANIKARMRKDGELVDEEGDDTTDGPTPGPSAGSSNGAANGSPNAPSGPQFRIVDGQIVVDQSSLVMDRHARAAATQGDLETIEENDFTRLITSNSFMSTSKLKGPNIWTPEESELFYRGLRMFGTDFEMISRMIAGKQRRHVKLKFNREERHNPGLIDAALIGEKTTKMDIDEYKAFTGAEFETVESIEAEQRRVEQEFEAQRQRIADEQKEAMRKKREELFADDDEDADAAGKKKRRGKKKGKPVVEYGLNGEPINVES